MENCTIIPVKSMYNMKNVSGEVEIQRLQMNKFETKLIWHQTQGSWITCNYIGPFLALFTGSSKTAQNVGELPSKPVSAASPSDNPSDTQPDKSEGESGWEEEGWGEMEVSDRDLYYMY